MPNLPQQQTIVQYVANSSQTAYTFAFYAPLPTDIQVYYQASNVAPNPLSQILVLNVNYTVTYNSDPTTGGMITLLFTPVTGYILTINRAVQATLNTNFSNAQNFSGANLDAALDRLLLLCQQNQNYALERNLSYIINAYLPQTVPYTQLPTLAQNQVWIGSGNGVIAGTLSNYPPASVLQSMLANNSNGTDGSLLVGFYNSISSVSTTVHAALSSLIQFFGASVSSVTGVTIPSANVPIKLLFGVVDFDPFSMQLNSTFTPVIVGGGYFIVNAGIELPPLANGNHCCQLYVYKNGSLFKVLDSQILTNNDYICLQGSCIVHLNGTTDYVEVWAACFGSATPVPLTGSPFGWFTMSLQGQ